MNQLAWMVWSDAQRFASGNSLNVFSLVVEELALSPCLRWTLLDKVYTGINMVRTMNSIADILQIEGDFNYYNVYL